MRGFPQKIYKEDVGMIKLLEGMRVVELASFMMGPIAGRVLGEWGAEVIKVEPALTPIHRKAFRLWWICA